MSKELMGEIVNLCRGDRKEAACAIAPMLGCDIAWAYEVVDWVMWSEQDRCERNVSHARSVELIDGSRILLVIP